MSNQDKKKDIALALEEIKDYDNALYQKIKSLITTARELKALKNGELIFGNKEVS
ncbi:hypothetical protein V1657_11710 [Clostridium perfringens]|uniref:hypothetical protein n=1 Tax=Clostridium perfringens TaxID=1502 RepID=UPI002ED57660|nr:hypothetical protein V1657_11710 [Clostridium perfringens]